MKGWRTLILNASAAGAALALEISSYLTSVEWNAYLPPSAALWALIAMNIANIVLRHITDRPAAWRGVG